MPELRLYPSDSRPTLLLASWPAAQGACRFAIQLQDELAKAGARLCVATYRWPELPLDFPYTILPGAELTDEDIQTFYDQEELDVYQDRDLTPYLERQELFTDPPDAPTLEKWRRGLQAYHKVYEELLDSTQPFLVLMWNGSRPLHLLLRDLVQERNIPLAYLERAAFPGFIHWDWEGILAGSASRRGTPGPVQAGDEERTAIVSSLFVGDDAPTGWVQPDLVGQTDLRKRFSLRPETKLLLFLAQVPADAQTLLYTPHFQSSLDGLRWLLAQLEGEDVFLVGKHHPKDPTEVSVFEEALGDRGAWVVDVPIQDCIRASDRVAALNSTGLYEALFHQKPVLLMGEAIMSGKQVAYEVSGRTNQEDTIRGWVHDTASEAMAQGWCQFVPWMLDQGLYCFEFPPERLGPAFQGPVEFAERALKFFQERPEGLPPAPRLDDSSWQRFARKYALAKLDRCAETVRTVLEGAPAKEGNWIWGAGTTGSTVRRFCESLGLSIRGWVDNDPTRQGTTFEGLPIVFGSDFMQKRPTDHKVFIASGAHRKIAYYLEENGWQEGRDFQTLYLTEVDFMNAGFGPSVEAYALSHRHATRTKALAV